MSHDRVLAQEFVLRVLAKGKRGTQIFKACLGWWQGEGGLVISRLGKRALFGCLGLSDIRHATVGKKLYWTGLDPAGPLSIAALLDSRAPRSRRMMWERPLRCILGDLADVQISHRGFVFMCEAFVAGMRLQGRYNGEPPILKRQETPPLRKIKTTKHFGEMKKKIPLENQTAKIDLNAK